MKSISLARFAPLALAATLLGSCAAFVFGFSAFLSQFIGFKIEMPMSTMLAINFSAFLTSPVGFITCGVLLFILVFTWASGDKSAWGIGLAVTFALGVAQFSLLLPMIAMMKSFVAPGIAHPMAQIYTTLGIALVPPLIFLALRHAFWKQQPRRNQTLTA